MPRKYTTEEAVKSFWDNVAITADSERCWLWTARIHPSGYGTKNWNGRKDQAHRVSWMINYGAIPDGLWVLHKCDNPTCVNPEHLFLGTRQDNIDDMVAKGRRADTHGENHPQHKIDSRQVQEIRKRYALGGVTQKALGREYGVNDRQISQIINYRVWKNI